jgi:hypothetical protein
MSSINRTARIAGLFYLVYVIASIVADLFGHFVFVDASATVSYIMAHESLFRIGVVISLFAQVLFLMAAWYLYVLLSSVNRNTALLFLLLNLGGFAMIICSHVNLVSSLMLVSGSDYLKIIQPDQLQAQATLFVNMYKTGSTIAQIPYGVWLLPLGYLVFKSGFLPRILGIFLIVDCVGLLTYVCQRFIFPDYSAVAYPCWVIGFIAEVSFTLWLLLKGAREPKPVLAGGQK